jgi:hypothetical protein
VAVLAYIGEKPVESLKRYKFGSFAVELEMVNETIVSVTITMANAFQAFFLVVDRTSNIAPTAAAGAANG